MNSVGERLWRFQGGIKLRHWKKLAIGESLNFAGIPDELTIPLNQQQGSAAKPVVAVGDRVEKYQLIASADGKWSAQLHAPTSGTIIAIEPRPVVHPSNLSALSIVLAADHQDRAIAHSSTPDWQTLPLATLQQRIAAAGLVGLGGAVFPTHVKTAKAATSNQPLLLLNGAECEPYIACDENLMRFRTREFLRGCQILAKAIDAAQTVIAIEDQMGATEHMLRACCEANGINGLDIIKVPTIYPEGAEDLLVKTLTGIEVPSGKTPLDIGVLCQNVGTAKAVHDAVVETIPLISRVVSITGRGFESPTTVEALIGTPISYLANLAGGYTESVSRLAVGGPMMGVAVASDDRPVTKATNCVLALTAQDTRPEQPELPCIRCMDCVAVCPAQLLPQQLLWYAKTTDFEQLEAHNLEDCIECGCCAYACPSQIPLVDYYRYAKAELWNQRRQHQQASHARARFEAREQRLARTKRERKQRLDQRNLAPSATDKQQAIADAIARAQQSKAKSGSGEN